MNGVLDGWFRAAPARRLGTLRVLIGSYALIYLLVRAPNLIRTAGMPASRFDPVGPVTVLTGPVPQWLAAALVGLALVLGALFVLGRRFSLVGPAFGVVLLWVLSYRNSWGMVFHTENLLVIHVLVLGLAPSADAHPWVADDRESEAHGWPIRLLAVVTVLTYVIAGVSKLRNAGLDWATSDILRNYVAFDNVRKAELGDAHSPIGALLVRHAWLFPPLAVGSLVMELGAPLALFHRRLAAVWCVCAWAFHAGVALVMWIFFPYPLLGMAYAPFFAVERGWDRGAAWLGTRLGFTRTR